MHLLWLHMAGGLMDEATRLMFIDLGMYTALDYLRERLDGDYELVIDHGNYYELFHYLPTTFTEA